MQKKFDPYLKKTGKTFADFLAANGSEAIKEWRLTKLGWEAQPGVINVLFSDNIDDHRRETVILPALADAFNLTLREPLKRVKNAWKRSFSVERNARVGPGTRQEDLFHTKQRQFLESELAKPLDTSSLLVGERLCREEPHEVTLAREWTLPNNGYRLRGLIGPPGCRLFESKSQALAVTTDRRWITLNPNYVAPNRTRTATAPRQGRRIGPAVSKRVYKHH